MLTITQKNDIRKIFHQFIAKDLPSNWTDEQFLFFIQTVKEWAIEWEGEFKNETED